MPNITGVIGKLRQGDTYAATLVEFNGYELGDLIELDEPKYNDLAVDQFIVVQHSKLNESQLSIHHVYKAYLTKNGDTTTFQQVFMEQAVLPILLKLNESPSQET